MVERPMERARSFLFVPATRPDRFHKAHAAGAGCVIVDLEDAVSPDQKTTSRDAIGQYLAASRSDVRACTLVRVNAIDTPWGADDLRAASEWAALGLGGLVLPKAEPESVRRAGSALPKSLALVALIESLAGLDGIADVARAPGVARLAFGHLDFQLDLGMRCSVDEAELAPVRFALVAASRRASHPAPIDGVTTATGHVEQLDADLRRARAFGFGGKLCIHPSQVAAADAAFAPSATEVAWARRVLEAADQHAGSTFSLDGRMVDLPVILLAKRTLALQR